MSSGSAASTGGVQGGLQRINTSREHVSRTTRDSDQSQEDKHRQKPQNSKLDRWTRKRESASRVKQARQKETHTYTNTHTHTHRQSSNSRGLTERRRQNDPERARDLHGF